MSEKIPLLIDTDPGVDDALALLMAFDSEAHDVVGLAIAAGALWIAQTDAHGVLRYDIASGALEDVSISE